MLTFGKSSTPVFLAVVKFFGTKAKTWKALTDQELIHRYRETGEGTWVAYLLERHRGLVISRCLEFLDDLEEVKDFAGGEMYLVLHRELKKEDTEIRSFPSWLWTLITRKMIDDRRKKQVRNDFRDAALLQESFTQPEGPEKTLSYQQDQGWLQAALTEALSEKERLVVEQLYFEEKPYKEVMDEMDLTFNQLRNLRFQALKKLKQHLGPEFEDYFNG